LVIRADGDENIGAGHVVRQLALAQAWYDAGGHVTLASARLASGLRELAAAESLEIVRVDGPDDLLHVAAERGADWVSVDGYGLADTAEAVVRGGRPLLVVDDHARVGAPAATVIVAQNLGASAATYPGDALRLLGPRYALLRRAFARAERGGDEARAKASRVLVTAGGGRPPAVLADVVQWINGMNLDLDIDVIVGRAADAQNLRKATGDNDRVHVRSAVSDMAAVMVRADLAVAAAGSTSWELCALGVPFAAFSTADNQEPVAAALAEAGVAIDLGWHEALSEQVFVDTVRPFVEDPERRAIMGARGRALVDGHGARRVSAALLARGMELRLATRADAELLWRWANDPAVRRWSFSPDEIGWEEHVAWFETRLASADSVIYIAVDEAGGPLGQVRFDMTGHRAEIGVSVAPTHRGQWRAAPLIRAAVDRVCEERSINTVVAQVKDENRASLQAFLAADFDSCGSSSGHDGAMLLRADRSHTATG
jgi:UDP-2,4-diacetamido-2,4,6-trideoxy-beta-L-altropyranose hydrolase